MVKGAVWMEVEVKGYERVVLDPNERLEPLGLLFPRRLVEEWLKKWKWVGWRMMNHCDQLA
jgi:hypothetical protein